MATARRCQERDKNNDNTNQNYRAAAGDAVAAAGAVRLWQEPDGLQPPLRRRDHLHHRFLRPQGGGTGGDHPHRAQRPYFPEELWYSLLFEAEGCVSRQIVIPRDFTGVLDTLLLRQAGDVNLDGQLDVYDLQLLYERMAGLVLLKEDYALLLADVNQDGLRNAQDLQRLYEQLTGTA